MKRRFGRRGFVQGSLAALAGARVPHLRRAADDVRLAVVGLNGRGATHIAGLQSLAGVRVAVLCDVDDQVLFRELKKQRERGLRPGAHSDLRHVLERSDVDAVLLATPDHWHALQTIWACQAGKHVFVERPATHLHVEGEHVLAAAQKHGTLVHTGHAAHGGAAALEWLRAGELGALELVRAIAYVPRPSTGRVRGNQPIPESIDYDLWCGPAPLEPLRRAALHGDWRWFHSTGGGALAADALAALDLARAVLGVETLPASVQSLGGRFGYEDDGETPNTQLVLCAFEPVPLLVELRGLPRDRAAQAGDWGSAMDDFLGLQSGVIAHCAGGTLRFDLAAAGGVEAVAFDAQGAELRRFDAEAAPAPLARWLEALQGGSAGSGTAELESGLRSSALLELATASQRLARAVEPAAFGDELANEIGTALGGAELAASHARLVAHLEANGVDLAQQKLALGPALRLDTHGRAQDERARELLAGSFRAPYALPGI